MRIAVLVIAFLILSPVAFGEEEHPLGCWAGLVGGAWHAKGAWEAGTPFVSRLKAEWGPAKSYMRFRIFLPAQDGEYVRYDSVYYRHPGEKRPAYLSASYTGDVAAGTFEISEHTATFVYPGKEGDPRRLRSTWRFLDADTCRWTVWQEPAVASEDPWPKLIAVDYRRKEQPAKKLRITRPPMPHQLSPLARYVGDRYEVTGQLGNGTKITGAIEHAWGVTHQVMVTRTFVTQEEEETLGFVGFTWWDAVAKTFRVIEFSAYGVFSEGTITVDRDTVVLSFTTWSKKEVKEYRQWTVFETDDRITWYVEEKTGEGWKKVTERMVGERDRGADSEE